jgi:hypothetical protein
MFLNIVVFFGHVYLFHGRLIDDVRVDGVAGPDVHSAEQGQQEGESVSPEGIDRMHVPRDDDSTGKWSCLRVEASDLSRGDRSSEVHNLVSESTVSYWHLARA